ncbi:MAG: hypothetical protein ABSF50_20595 [Burkholderiaceae bacterium]
MSESNPDTIDESEESEDRRRLRLQLQAAGESGSPMVLPAGVLKRWLNSQDRLPPDDMQGSGGTAEGDEATGLFTVREWELSLLSNWPGALCRLKSDDGFEGSFAIPFALLAELAVAHAILEEQTPPPTPSH